MDLNGVAARLGSLRGKEAQIRALSHAAYKIIYEDMPDLLIDMMRARTAAEVINDILGSNREVKGASASAKGSPKDSLRHTDVSVSEGALGSNSKAGGTK